MTQATGTAKKPYLVDRDSITKGERGANILRDPQQIEEFPNSSCIKKATLWIDSNSSLRTIKFYFKSGNSRFTVYEYEGHTEQVESDFQMLVQARENGESVGQLYNKIFKNGAYAPSNAIA